MPRSGTTLTESITIANDEVFAGELVSFYDLAYRFTLEEKPEIQNKEKIGDDYIRRTSFFLQNGNNVVDKLSNNFMFLGYIKKFLPRSKSILFLELGYCKISHNVKVNISYASSFFNIGIQILTLKHQFYIEKKWTFKNNV